MNGNPQYQEDTLALEEVSEDSLYTLWLRFSHSMVLPLLSLNLR